MWIIFSKIFMTDICERLHVNARILRSHGYVTDFMTTGYSEGR
jgi:hypothetical protein